MKMNEEKDFYEGTDEKEIFESFMEELERYDYTPDGIGKAIAFLYDNLDDLRRRRKSEEEK